MSQPVIPNGTLVIGTFKGYSERPWTNDPTKFNRRIGISTGSYTDEFGQQHENTVVIDIQMDDAQRIQSMANDLVGKSVYVPVVFKAKVGGRSGAWESLFMPKGAQIGFVPQSK